MGQCVTMIDDASMGSDIHDDGDTSVVRVLTAMVKQRPRGAWRRGGARRHTKSEPGLFLPGRIASDLFEEDRQTNDDERIGEEVESSPATSQRKQGRIGEAIR